MGRSAKTYKTSVSLNRMHMREIRKMARERKRSASFIIREIIEKEAELRAKQRSNNSEAPSTTESQRPT